MDLIIDKEFKDCMRPLHEEERDLLESSLIAEGCREPLSVWGNIIIDGMNRWEICIANGIPFKTKPFKFVDRDDVLDWIELNQLARRNLTPDEYRYARGRRYNRLKRKDGGHGDQSEPRNIRVSGGHYVLPLTAAEKVAKECGVNPRTIRRDGRAVEEIESSPVKELGRMVQSGRVSINAAAAIASLPEQEQREIVKAEPQAIKAKAKEILAAKPEPDTNKWPVKLRPVFAEAVIFSDALNHLTQLSKVVNQITGGNEARKGNGSPMACGVALANEFQRVATLVKEIRGVITMNAPENICPYCKAEKQKCESCRNTGWSTKFQWDTAPKKLKDEVGA